MDLRDLRAFVAIADDMNFTTAAAKLGTTQPSLSRRILELEGEIGLPLFVRHARGATLTVAGHRLVFHARDVQKTVERFIRVAHRVRRHRPRGPASPRTR